MKKTHLISLSFLLSLLLTDSAAQDNLVPNASFEDIANCPYDDGQIYFAEPWFSASTTGTPDLMNACSTDERFGVPCNRYGGQYCQPGRTGAGYAGIGVYNHFSNFNTREYIEVQLVRVLGINKQYYIRFFVSTSTSQTIGAPCYCDGIGATFTKDKYISQEPGIPVLSDLHPVIDNKGKILHDSANWMPINGCFTNTGSEKNYLIIGNFRDNAQTLFSPECDLSFPNGSYLYIEDVGVWEFDPLPDTVLLCKGDSKLFNASFLNASCKWSDGSTDTTYNIFKEGVYSVSTDIEGCTLSDTTIVIEIDKQLDTSIDTLICEGEEVRLFSPVPGDYLWSTGEKSSSINVSSAGTYTVDVTNECGIFSFENHIETKVCDCSIYVPNVFSPDGIAPNNELKVFSACDFPLHVNHFQVFDRWGNLIYESFDDNIEHIRWDGRLQGNLLTSGVYTWLMEYNIVLEGQVEKKILKGDITLLR